MSERLQLVALVGAVVLVAGWVQVRTPVALLAPAHRPDEIHGNPAVRLESPVYPRVATGADDVAVTITAPPQRIISQYWSADEFLYAIVPPERIVGVSDTAYAPQSSNVLPFVERYRPIVSNDAERVLRANPDLVLAPESESSDEPSLLREA